MNTLHGGEKVWDDGAVDDGAGVVSLPDGLGPLLWSGRDVHARWGATHLVVDLDVGD